MPKTMLYDMNGKKMHLIYKLYWSKCHMEIYHNLYHIILYMYIKNNHIILLIIIIVKEKLLNYTNVLL